MKIGSLVVAVFSLLLSLTAVAVAEDESKPEVASWGDFRIISERNIFSRNRVVYVRPQNTKPMNIQREQPREEGFLTLRGITKQADGFTAFIEDTRTMEVKKILRQGTIGKGTVKVTTLDSIIYELEGKSTTVKIGMTMGGQAAESRSLFSGGFGVFQKDNLSSPPSPSVTEDKEQSVPQNENTSDILKRLRERRKKELGQ